MLIYVATGNREKQLFSDFATAKVWTEAHASYGPEHTPYWKQNSTHQWVLCSGGTGFQVGDIQVYTLDISGEEDPLRQLAFKILANDPQALDAAKDVLKC